MTKCLICTSTIVGRTDKKFCSLRCKNFYHTNLNKVNKLAVIEIDGILHRNRAILLEIMGKYMEQVKISRMELDKRKFNFKYHTHFQVNSQGKTYFYVYDFAWMEFSNDEVLIVRRKSK